MITRKNVGDLDGNGSEITKIHYQLLSGNDWYILYDNNEGKLSQGADGIYLERLLKLNSEISALVALTEKLTVAKSIFSKKKQLNNKYNPLIANTISSSISGDATTNDSEKLKKLQSQIEGEIESWAKLGYLRKCLGVVSAVFLLALLFWFYESRIALTNKFLIHFDNYFVHSIYLSAAGAVGAFISVTQKINTLEIDQYLPDKRTLLNASIRIILGVIFGNLLFWFLRADFIKIVDRDELFFGELDNTLLCLLVGVIGGFSERLVPDILGKKAASDKNSENTTLGQGTKKTDAATDKQKKNQKDEESKVDVSEKNKKK